MVLTGIINGLNDPKGNDEIMISSISGLLNTLRFASNNFAVPTEREAIMNEIFKCLSHRNVEVRVLAMQCLVEVSREFYDHISNEIPKIGEYTMHAVTNDDPNVALQALEFWCSICDEEIERKKTVI